MAHREVRVDGEDQEGAEPEQQRLEAETRTQQHELPVARHEEIADLRIRFSGAQLLADEGAQIMGESGVRIVDRFVLADEAAELAREGARPCLESLIGEHLVRLDGEGGTGRDQGAGAGRDEQGGKHRSRGQPAPAWIGIVTL